MPTVRDVAEQVKFLMEHGRSEEKAVLVLPRVANRRKQKNPQKKFTKAMDDTHASRWYAVWDKWLEAAENKTVAIELMLHTLEGISVEQIRAAAKDDQTQPVSDPDLPKANIPPSPFSEAGAEEQADMNFMMGTDEHVGE